MNRPAAILPLLILFVLCICGQPLAAQDPEPQGDPAALPNRVLVDPAPGQTWGPYEMIVEGRTPVSVPSTINRPMAEAGMMDYVQFDVLLVFYTHTAAGQMSQNYVEMAKEHARRTRDYIWRNSHFKLFLNLTFLVIDEYVDASEFINSSLPCNWMSPDDFDGDGESPSADILAHGFVKDQFDSINLLWARTYPGTISLCPYGGLAWFNGWYWRHLGHTMFTTNLMYPMGERLWIPFNHEFQHSIDGAFALNGRPEYFHADYPWARPYRFGDNWHIHAVEMRHWPPEDWLDLVGIWGEYRQAPDVDGDGVPDSGDLPVTEIILGSSPVNVDSEGDGFNDLQEAMAGMFGASDPLAINSDGDAWEDADDFAPLYPLNDRFVKKERTLNGNPEGWTLLTDYLHVPQGEFSAAIYGNWIEGMLYMMFEINQPARVHVRIDAKADGFWTGRDNYAIELDPWGDPLRFATVNDCTPEQTGLEEQCRYDNEPDYKFPRVIDPAEIGRFTTYDGQNYIIQVAVPADADSGFNPQFSSEIGLDVRFDDVDGVGGRTARPFEEDDLIYLRLLTADAAWIDGKVFDLGTCGDEKKLLTGSLASFTGKSGQNYDLWTDPNGSYGGWLVEEDNPYTLTVSKGGYVTEVYEGIAVEAGGLNQYEAGLQKIGPCLKFGSGSSSQMLRLGTSGSSTLLVQNDGLQSSDFDLYVEYGSSPYREWLRLSQLDGWLAAGEQVAVTLTYDAGLPGAAPGFFKAALELYGDPYNPEVHEVALEIVDFGLAVVPLEEQVGGKAGTDVTGRFTLTNEGTVVDTFDVVVKSSWPGVVSFSEVTLEPGEEVEVLLTLAIPPGAQAGDTETAVLTVTSRAAPDIREEASFQVSVTESNVFLPLVRRP